MYIIDRRKFITQCIGSAAALAATNATPATASPPSGFAAFESSVDESVAFAAAFPSTQRFACNLDHLFTAVAAIDSALINARAIYGMSRPATMFVLADLIRDRNAKLEEISSHELTARSGTRHRIKIGTRDRLETLFSDARWPQRWAAYLGRGHNMSASAQPVECETPTKPIATHLVTWRIRPYM